MAAEQEAVKEYDVDAAMKKRLDRHRPADTRLISLGFILPGRFNGDIGEAWEGVSHTTAQDRHAAGHRGGDRRVYQRHASFLE